MTNQETSPPATSPAGSYLSRGLDAMFEARTPPAASRETVRHVRAAAPWIDQQVRDERLAQYITGWMLEVASHNLRRLSAEAIRPFAGNATEQAIEHLWPQRPKRADR